MFIGKKRKIYFDQFLHRFFPKNIKIYVEPFGGSFSVSTYLKNRPTTMVYNDINYYPDIDIKADHIHYGDYIKMFNEYDSPNTVFYIDPPYYGKEYLYDGCDEYQDSYHIKLMQDILKLKGRVIISYENHPFILKLYKEFNVYKYDGERFNFRNEIVITNFKN